MNGPYLLRSESAGGIVVNPRGEILIVEQKGGSWSLPKGHLKPREGPRRAARREIAEEAGIDDLVFLKSLGSYERTNIVDPHELKTIHLFLFKTAALEAQPRDADNPRAQFVSVDSAIQLLTHRADKRQVGLARRDIREAVNIESGMRLG